MPITRSIPLLCTSKIRSIVCGERSRTPSTSPPQATADWRRATERALPWPLAAPMSARRQRSVQLHSCSGGMVGLVQVLNAALLGSSCVGSKTGIAGFAGGDTKLATRGEVRGRQADAEADSQRPRYARDKELTQAPAGDAPDHFADQ